MPFTIFTEPFRMTNLCSCCIVTFVMSFHPFFTKYRTVWAEPISLTNLFARCPVAKVVFVSCIHFFARRFALITIPIPSTDFFSISFVADIIPIFAYITIYCAISTVPVTKTNFRTSSLVTIKMTVSIVACLTIFHAISPIPVSSAVL